MCVCVCVCVCLYVLVFVRARVLMRVVRWFVRVCVCVGACARVREYVRAYKYIDIVFEKTNIHMYNPGRADTSEAGSRRLCVDPNGHGFASFSAREARLYFLAREARRHFADARSAPKRSNRFTLFLAGSRRLCVDPEGHG